MKILGSFDTKKDENELRQKLEQFGEGRCMLVRSHPLRFIFHGGNVLIMFLLLVGVLVTTYFQYEEDLGIFALFSTLYLSGVGIWIFMLVRHILFRLRHTEPYYDRWNAEVFNASSFERVIVWSLWLFFFQVLIAISNFSVSFLYNDISWKQIGFSIFDVIVNFSFIGLVWKVIKTLIDMEMDYLIVTPDDVVYYNQTGFFTRESFSIGCSKVKSLMVEKNGIVSALFNLGYIHVLTEGDDEGGQITFVYIWRADQVREEMLKIINLHKAIPAASAAISED